MAEELFRQGMRTVQFTAWGPEKFLSSWPLLQHILMGETALEVRDDREVARWGPYVSTASVYNNSCLSRQQ